MSSHIYQFPNSHCKFTPITYSLIQLSIAPKGLNLNNCRCNRREMRIGKTAPIGVEYNVCPLRGHAYVSYFPPVTLRYTGGYSNLPPSGTRLHYLYFAPLK